MTAPSVTASGSGATSFSGFGGIVVAVAQASGSGKQAFEGTGASQTAAPTAAGLGLMVLDGHAANGTATTGAATANASGLLKFIGSGSIDVASIVCDATAEQSFIGSGSCSLSAPTCAATGTHYEFHSNGAIQTPSPLSVSGVGKLSFLGVGSPTSPFPVANGSGRWAHIGTAFFVAAVGSFIPGGVAMDTYNTGAQSIDTYTHPTARRLQSYQSGARTVGVHKPGSNIVGGT